MESVEKKGGGGGGGGGWLVLKFALIDPFLILLKGIGRVRWPSGLHVEKSGSEFAVAVIVKYTFFSFY